MRSNLATPLMGSSGAISYDILDFSARVVAILLKWKIDFIRESLSARLRGRAASGDAERPVEAVNSPAPEFDTPKIGQREFSIHRRATSPNRTLDQILPKLSHTLFRPGFWVNNLVGFGPRKEPVAERRR